MMGQAELANRRIEIPAHGYFLTRQPIQFLLDSDHVGVDPGAGYNSLALFLQLLGDGAQGQVLLGEGGALPGFE